MDEESIRSAPLTPLPEDEEAPRSDQDTRNSSAADLPLSTTSLPTTSRRRRLFHRLARFAEPASPESSSAGPRSPPNFNPQAAEFVPSAKMAPKRKASSSVRSGKSTLPALRTSSVPADQPVINSEDLFGADGASSASGALGVFESILDDTDDENSSDIFQLEMQDLDAVGQNRPVQQRERLHEALAVMRHRTNEKVRLAPAAPQSKSALLFAYDQPASAEFNASSRLRYLPLCPSANSARRESISKETNLTVLHSAQQQIDDTMTTSTASRAQWPANQLPVEIFELIIDYLSRDDVKSMRLVTKEFEEKVSRSLFNTSVVPFNTELYDMIDEDARAFNRGSRAHPGSEGKGKARAQDMPDAVTDLRSRLQWQNAKDDSEGKVYRGHGLRVFQGFGPHIKRFGMSFEVAEGQLSRPPIKKELDHVESYYGSYDWPTQQYTRFANLAGLERTADDTLRMKAAFSNLDKVRDLGISVDSGLGWLNGPDKSMRAQIFERPSSIFGDSREIPDRQMQEAQDFWNTVQSCHRGLGVNSPKEVLLAHKHLNKSPADLRGLQGTRYADSQRWPSIAASRAIAAPGNSKDTQYGVLYTTCDLTSSSLFDKSALMPADLRKEQKEWLLETEWAQRAFLECYMLAVIDNPTVFETVKTLNIAKLSSGFLPLLANEPFWDALPGLTDVTLHVKPDWRTVEKDNAGFAETSNQNPSEAVKAFNKFITGDRFCVRPSITTLNIGWAAGGEYAEGIFARNANILPAPITQLEHTTAAAAIIGTVFKYVEHLTLTNCWITPPTLVGLVRSHAGTQLKKLTLDSVSLTAHPRFPAGGQQHQIAQALAVLQPGAFPPGAAQQHPNLHNNQLIPQVQAQFNQQNQMVFPAWPQMPPPPPFINNFNAQQAAIQAGGPHGAPAQWVNHFPPFNQAFQGNQPGFVPNFMPQGHMPPPQNAVQFNAPPNPPVPQPPPHWTAGHREGSWPEILDKISPGAVFDDYLPQPAPWEEQLPERPTTSLQTLELKSCGYAKLGNNNSFDQFAIEANFDHHLSNWFRTRQLALSAAMMTSSDRFMARIVQHIPQRELDAMLFAWGLTEGWEDRAKAEEAEYDGLLPGGTGRVSGRVDKGMALLAQPEARE